MQHKYFDNNKSSFVSRTSNFEEPCASQTRKQISWSVFILILLLLKNNLGLVNMFVNVSNNMFYFKRYVAFHKKSSTQSFLFFFLTWNHIPNLSSLEDNVRQVESEWGQFRLVGSPSSCFSAYSTNTN